MWGGGPGQSRGTRVSRGARIAGVREWGTRVRRRARMRGWQSEHGGAG